MYKNYTVDRLKLEALFTGCQAVSCQLQDLHYFQVLIDGFTLLSAVNFRADSLSVVNFVLTVLSVFVLKDLHCWQLTFFKLTAS
jgi:hypothetical protein